MISIRSISRFALAWTPFFVLWVLFIRVFIHDEFVGALVSGIESTLTAALMGVLVWRLSGRLTWPDRMTPRFVLVHAGSAVPYALGWAISAYIFSSLRTDEPFLETILTSEVFAWRILMGAWLYAIVAGVSYAVRNRNRLTEQERIAARAEALVLEARLTALRAQLNPHFLFNALHSVNALIRRDPEKAEQAVEELADLLRYSLDEGNDSLVPLDDEWAFTSGYLRLQGIRFGERLSVRSNLEADTLVCLVPPFILQPLVENAVEHGISNRIDGGEVSITSNLRDGHLILKVEDYGLSERVDSGDNDQDANGRDESGHGTGLDVLGRRLDALFGDRGRLDVQNENGIFTATVTIPV